MCAAVRSARWCPGITAKVVDDNGDEVPPRHGGQAGGASDRPAASYIGRRAPKANYVKAGWNHPGDAFVQDADGYFFYQARVPTT
jgi:2-aminobenzoate-CoA ligase